jgi:hypothetical protein
MANPILAIAAAIAAAAYAIWSNWDTLGPMFVGLWERIKAAFAAGWEWVKSSTSAALQWFFNLPTRFMELGSQIMQGMVRGIESGLGKVKEAITGAGDATISWFKEKLGIHSPSRVFAQLGGFTMAGLQQGIAGGQDGPLSAVLGVAKRLTAAGAGIALGIAGPAMAMQLDQRGPMRPRHQQQPWPHLRPSALSFTPHRAWMKKHWPRPWRGNWRNSKTNRRPAAAAAGG